MMSAITWIPLSRIAFRSRLKRFGEASLVQAFEPDRQARAPGTGGEIEQLGVARDVDRRLTRPFYLVGDHRAEELLRVLRPRDRIVVEEDDARTSEAADLLDVGEHVVHRPGAVAPAVVGLHRAVVARMRAAPGEQGSASGSRCGRASSSGMPPI
jgi:hypothetical protein